MTEDDTEIIYGQVKWFDPAKGLEALAALEAGWGGTAQQRLEARYAAYAASGSVPRSRGAQRRCVAEGLAMTEHPAANAQTLAAQEAAPTDEASPSVRYGSKGETRSTSGSTASEG